jgi:5'-nucleotidase/UDP-sugar diphosphatase
MKNYLFLLLLVSSQLYAYTADKIYKFTILHTNDHHGRFWPNNNGELGLAPRATVISQIKAEVEANGGNVLVLDAGDVNTGLPHSDMLQAEPDFKAMGMIGYDVMAIGNHEFDNSYETILKQQKWAGFPFISANIYFKDNNQRVFPDHIVKNFDDLKITIFGLTTEDTPVKSSPVNTKPFKFVPVVEEAKKLVPKLKEQTDVLIALTHIGHYADGNHGADAPGDVTLARSVDGIDVIVGGHSHNPLYKPDIQNGTIIVQAEEWGKYVGRVDFEFQNGKLRLVDYKLIPINLLRYQTPDYVTQRIAADPYIETFLLPYKMQGDDYLSQEIGYAEVEFVGQRNIVRFQETNLGNLITEAYRARFDTDIGLTNSGGIRDSIHAGKVTYETALTVLPFGGKIVTAKLKGRELKKYLEYILLELTPGSGSFPQFSRVSAKIDRKNKKVYWIKVNNKRINPFKSYKVALPQFIAAGGDKYPKIDYQDFDQIDADILKQYVKSLKVLKADHFKVTGKIIEIK